MKKWKRYVARYIRTASTRNSLPHKDSWGNSTSVSCCAQFAIPACSANLLYVALLYRHFCSSFVSFLAAHTFHGIQNPLTGLLSHYRPVNKRTHTHHRCLFIRVIILNGWNVKLALRNATNYHFYEFEFIGFALRYNGADGLVLPSKTCGCCCCCAFRIALMVGILLPYLCSLHKLKSEFDMHIFLFLLVFLPILLLWD